MIFILDRYVLEPRMYEKDAAVIRVPHFQKWGGGTSGFVSPHIRHRATPLWHACQTKSAFLLPI